MHLGQRPVTPCVASQCECKDETKTENQSKELKMRITALEEALTTERTKIQKEEEKNKKNTQTIKQLQGKINQTRENNKKEMKKEEKKHQKQIRELNEKI